MSIKIWDEATGNPQIRAELPTGPRRRPGQLQSGFSAARKVIDISGDGVNNAGPPPAEARDRAVAAGITINGLPIVELDPSLAAYYRTNVIGGPDAFVEVATDLGSFAGAVLRKLIVEVSGRRPATAFG